MQSLQSQRASLVHLSCIDMEKEDDSRHKQLCKNALNQQSEILRLPNIRSFVNGSRVDNNNNLQKEFFSLKIRNCTLFKAVPLPHISKKVPPHVSDAASKVPPSKESLSLLFLPEKDHFEKLFHCFDGAVAAGWLEKAHILISDLGTWSCSSDNFVHFAHFWLSELQFNQKHQLLELEMGVIEDEVRLAFPEAKESQQLDLNSILATVLSEYPMGLVNNQNSYVFLDYLNLMSSEGTAGYKQMLSSIQYTTKNPQIAQWLLAVRAFALANLWHAIVKFYKALISTQLPSEQHIKSCISTPRKPSSEVLKERALQSVQLGFADVLDYLVQSQELDLSVVDDKNRNLLFLATVYDQSKILDYFLDLGHPVPDVNQAAENGNTPLHAAINTGKMHLVSLLLHYPGINVNVPNPQCDKATALHLAIAYVPDDLSVEEREELLNIRRRKKELIDDIERLKFEIAEVMTEIDNLTSVEESKTTQRNKQIAMGRKKFNMDPKKGIQFLIENDLLQNTPEDIAQFLYKGEGLNKTVIGDYLGERDDFNIKVLQAFVELHEFADLNLVQALRQFLWSFRLPGEAQKIDRMMEAFASRYCLCNPGVFQSTDTCYVLSFAIIMLNTSLHNHNVRDKPTVERFISMNRGINEGGDLPEELLRNLYESIKNEPFKIPEDDGNDLTHTFFNPDREGWLLKLGGRVKTWKRRWFILTDNCLYYFEYTTDKEPRGIIPLENLSIREVEDPRKPNCFELYNPSHKGQVIKACKTEADGRVVEGNHVVYRISAPTPEEKEEWIKSIKASISRDPFYDMLATRKRRIANKK
ncbi:cytohesin-3 isoform X1 [Tiliqua scincoides]